jgi:hypothetical protein
MGQPMALEIYITVRWPWIAFLAGQIFLSVVLLITTIVKTELMGIDIIKGASLPVLFAIRSWDIIQLNTGFASERCQEEYCAIQKEGRGIVNNLTRTEAGWILESVETSSHK